MRSQTKEFRFRHEVDVRFRDIDIGGHAHHSQAFIYIEEARGAYWRQIVGRDGPDDVDYILADAAIRFRRRVLYPDRLEVSARVSVLGKKHFEMEYEVRSGAGELLIAARTTQVMYDYEVGRTKAIPTDLRARIESYDGPFGSGV